MYLCTTEPLMWTHHSMFLIGTLCFVPNAIEVCIISFLKSGHLSDRDTLSRSPKFSAMGGSVCVCMLTCLLRITCARRATRDSHWARFSDDVMKVPVIYSFLCSETRKFPCWVLANWLHPASFECSSTTPPLLLKDSSYNLEQPPSCSATPHGV